MATILVVEDEPHQRLLYQMELEDEGYDVVPGRRQPGDGSAPACCASRANAARLPLSGPSGIRQA